MQSYKTDPKLYVFVLMPFDTDFRDTYEFGIKAACDEAGMYCERVDETHVLGTLYDKIVNSIAKADIVIADLTARNANVYYETGYAHALSKVTIHLCRDIKEIPFDLLGFQHIEYSGSIVELKRLLKEKLTWAADYIRTQGRELGATSFEFYVDGKELAERVTLPILWTYRSDGAVAQFAVDFDLEVRNSGLSKSQEIGPLYIYTNAVVLRAFVPDGVTINDAVPAPARSEVTEFERRHEIAFRRPLAAGEVQRHRIRMTIDDRPSVGQEGPSFPLKLRLLTESAPIDRDFLVNTVVTAPTPAVDIEFPGEVAGEVVVHLTREYITSEEGFQLPVLLRNRSAVAQRLGHVEVYMDDAIVSCEPDLPGISFSTTSYFGSSDEPSFSKKYVSARAETLDAGADAFGVWKFELARRALKSGETHPIMIKLQTERGIVSRATVIRLE